MYRVMIVDDEPLIRKGLRETINWEVLDSEIVGEAQNGKEALSLIHKLHPQILVTDVKMPHMDGVELIRRIRAENLNIKIIILSGYNDYELLKKSIQYNVDNYLLKPIDNDELYLSIQMATKKIDEESEKQYHYRQGMEALKTNVLIKLLEGTIREAEYIEKAEFLNITFDEVCFAAGIIQVQVGNKALIKDDKKLNRYAVMNTVKELLGESHYVLWWNEDQISLVLNFKDKKELDDNVMIILKDCIKKVEQYLQIEIKIGIGGIVESPLALHHSFESAKNNIAYGSILNESSFIQLPLCQSLEDLTMLSDDFSYLMFDSLFMNEESIGNRNDCIEKFFNIIVGIPHITIEQIRKLVFERSSKLCDILLQQVGESSFNGMSYKRYNDLLNCKHLSEFKKWFYALVDDIDKFTCDQKQKKYKPADCAIKLIKLHFTEDISIKWIASKLYMNPSYLGQIFKKEIGVSFTEYVNRLRIEKAKELLLQSHLKIFEITQEVGFSDAHYFLKIFKKYTGSSPSDYRK